jgi:hypothetical protein
MNDADRNRLIAILGMLGSASAGERDNAARLAEQFRHQHGVTWSDVLAPKVIFVPTAPPPDPEAEPPPPPYEPPAAPQKSPSRSFFREQIADTGMLLVIGGIVLVLVFALTRAWKA